MSIRLVVTGCPRSGTKYTTEVLRSLGFKAGHEQCFTPIKHAIAGSMNEIEASWMAAPFLPTLPRDIFVVHQVRNPLMVVRSLLAGDHLGFNSPYSRFVYKYLLSLPKGALPSAEAQIRAEDFWLLWNLIIERGVKNRASVRLKVEDLKSPNVPSDHNTWGKTEALKYPLQQATIQTARKYGYNL
jgi:hypothetical protein